MTFPRFFPPFFFSKVQVGVSIVNHDYLSSGAKETSSGTQNKSPNAFFCWGIIHLWWKRWTFLAEVIFTELPSVAGVWVPTPELFGMNGIVRGTIHNSAIVRFYWWFGDNISMEQINRLTWLRIFISLSYSQWRGDPAIGRFKKV